MSLGIGSMLHALSGGTKHGSNEYTGKVISFINLIDDNLLIDFTDGKKIKIFDDGQSCCESRYMRTDDDLSHLVGKTLVHIMTKEAPNEPDEYGEHEVVFLEVMTNDGFATMSFHNEHNGYYGGFGLSIDEIQ